MFLRPGCWPRLGGKDLERGAPYGTTKFAYTATPTSRSLNITDPLGNTSRTEFAATSSLATDPPPNKNWSASTQGYSNTFYWDGEAHARAPGNITQAHIWRWLPNETDQISASPESEKLPLESRVWYLRDGQVNGNSLNGALRNAPSQIARSLPGGETQFNQIAYTASGNPTQGTDPMGRQVQTSYDASGTDLTTVARKTPSGPDTLAQYTYGAVPHRPTAYTDAAGQTWRMSYNQRGQLLTATDPQGHTTTHTYNANGYLTQTTGPQGKVLVPVGILYCSQQQAYALTNLRVRLQTLHNLFVADRRSRCAPVTGARFVLSRNRSSSARMPGARWFRTSGS